MSKQRPSQKPPAAPSLTRLLPGLLLGSVVALLVATPILPSEAVASDGTHATLSMLWCLLLVGWTLAVLGQLVPPLRLDWTLVAAIVLIGLHALSAIVMGRQGGARPAFNVLWVWVDYGIAAFLLRQLITSSVQSRALVAVMTALGICLAMHAGYQYFVSQPALQRAYKANPDKFLEDSGISKDPNSQERKHFEDRLRSREPVATFALTNSLAGYLAPWLVIAAGIALGELSRGGNRKALVAGVLAALLMAGCLLLTKSRTGVLAAFSGGVLLLLYGRRGGIKIGWKIPALAVGILGLISLGVIVAGGLDAKVLSEAPTSVLYRVQYWRSTAAMIADHPLWGCGPGRFQALYAHYKLPEASETVADPHNFILEVWSTAGSPALLALLAMMVACLAELWRGNAISNQTTDGAAPDQQKLPHEPVTSSFASLYWGALVGVPLGLGLAYLGGQNVLSRHNGGAVGLLVLGLPVAACFLGAMHGWVKSGQMHVSLPAIGLVVLGVDLLAAGAAGFPGVAQTGWVLMPLALSLSPSRCDSCAVSGWRGALAIAGSALISLACYGTGYAPVLYSQASLSDAETPLQSADQVAAHLSAAAAKDPWSATPWERLAELRLSLWLRNGWENDLNEFVQAANEFSRREVPSYRASQKRARWYLQVYARSQKSEHLEEALAACRQAAGRNPSSALVHAELAAVWKLADDDSAAQIEAEEALRLDGLNPHAEFKLQRHHLQVLRWDVDASRLIVEERPETAEQTMLELRKGLRPKPRPEKE